MAKKPINEIEVIKEISTILKDQNLSEIEIEKDGLKIRVQNHSLQSNQASQIISSPLPNQVIAPEPIPTGHGEQDRPAPSKQESSKCVKSPMVGTCYLSPEPGSKPFIEIGKKISKGDPIIIIEAMKTFNTIPSTETGIIKKIFVTDGQPIEFGEDIIEIE
jgi:acetyl-CoA carboxylase biotin carboxyl carrier protein